MGLSQNHLLAHFVKNYAMRETTPGTFVKAVTTQSVSTDKWGGSFNGALKFQPNQERKDDLTTYLQSRRITSRITGKTNHSWSVEGRYVPSGDKTEPPDFSPFIEAAMGSLTAGTANCVYALNSSQQLLTLSLVSQVETEEMQQCAAGCMVENMSFKFAGGSEPMFSAGGRAMTYVATGRSTLDEAMVGATTTMVVQTADQNSFDCMPAAYATDPPTAGVPAAGARSVIEIDDGSSPQTDAEVTVSGSAPSFTIDTGGTHDDEATVSPYVPTHTDVGSPISGVSGSVTWDSFSAVVTAAEVNLVNNYSFFDDEALTQHLYDGVPNIQEITGSLTFRVRRDHLVHILNRKAFSSRALTLVAGGAAASGTRLSISIPQCEVEFSEFDLPETGEITMTMPFKALDSSANDAMTITHS